VRAELKDLCCACVLRGDGCSVDGWLALSRVGEVIALRNVGAIGGGSMLWCWVTVRLGEKGG
jgi:hypothetical protein